MNFQPETRNQKPETIRVLIPAGGSGIRFGGVKKQFQLLHGETLLNRCIKKFLERDDVCQIVISLPEEDLHHQSLIKEDRVRFVAGGATRTESVRNAMNSLTHYEERSIILIHDAARPFVTQSLITRVIEATKVFGAVIPVIPVVDTIKQVDENEIVVKTLPREDLRAVQTPQGFWYELLKKAYDQLNCRGVWPYALTDEAMLIEKLGHPVHVVEGDVGNIKITSPFDLTGRF